MMRSSSRSSLRSRPSSISSSVYEDAMMSDDDNDDESVVNEMDRNSNWCSSSSSPNYHFMSPDHNNIHTNDDDDDDDEEYIIDYDESSDKRNTSFMYREQGANLFSTMFETPVESSIVNEFREGKSSIHNFQNAMTDPVVVVKDQQPSPQVTTTNSPSLRRRRARFQQQRRETKAALREKLPLKYQVLAICLALSAGFLVFTIILALVVAFLSSGFTFNPEEYGV